MKRETRAALITGIATVMAAFVTVLGARVWQSGNVGQPAQLIPPALLPRVVLHVRVGDSLSVARHVKPRLSDAGYDVPDIRMVNRDMAPPTTLVRYFEESKSADADKLVELLRSWGVGEVDKQFVEKYPRIDNTRRDYFEVWFATRSRADR